MVTVFLFPSLANYQERQNPETFFQFYVIGTGVIAPCKYGLLKRRNEEKYEEPQAKFM